MGVSVGRYNEKKVVGVDVGRYKGKNCHVHCH
jgi:hypothetical protein